MNEENEYFVIFGGGSISARVKFTDESKQYFDLYFGSNNIRITTVPLQTSRFTEFEDDWIILI